MFQPQSVNLALQAKSDSAPFLEPLEHNLGQKSSIKRLFQPTLGPISALATKSALANWTVVIVLLALGAFLDLKISTNQSFTVSVQFAPHIMAIVRRRRVINLLLPKRRIAPVQLVYSKVSYHCGYHFLMLAYRANNISEKVVQRSSFYGGWTGIFICQSGDRTTSVQTLGEGEGRFWIQERGACVCVTVD